MLASGAGVQALGGLLPGMEPEVEGAPMHREQRTRVDAGKGVKGPVGTQMDVAPGGVEGADFKQGDVKGTKAGADVGMFAGGAGVAGEKHRDGGGQAGTSPPTTWRCDLGRRAH